MIACLPPVPQPETIAKDVCTQYNCNPSKVFWTLIDGSAPILSDANQICSLKTTRNANTCTESYGYSLLVYVTKLNTRCCRVKPIPNVYGHAQADDLPVGGAGRAIPSLPAL
ncbi:hypothetical protein VTK56DRAFT_2528 [Thermocarpiscus australiensis]